MPGSSTHSIEMITLNAVIGILTNRKGNIV